MADTEGIHGVRSHSPHPVFKYFCHVCISLFRKAFTHHRHNTYWNIIFQIFHFHGIYKKNEIKSAKRIPPPPTHTPLYINSAFPEILDPPLSPNHMLVHKDGDSSLVPMAFRLCDHLKMSIPFPILVQSQLMCLRYIHVNSPWLLTIVVR